MANLNNIYKVTAAQYSTLISGGTVGGKSYDANAIYLIESSNAGSTSRPVYYSDGAFTQCSYDLNKTGSTNTTSQIYLIGATSQANSATTYSRSTTYVNSSGCLYSTTFNASSDSRLKENIISYVPQKSILDLDIKKFDFIDGPKNQIGCLAQDLQEICPEIVTADEKGYLSIQESKLIYLLLDEVKKLKAEITELKSK